jgi:hypothetical protein
MLRRAVATVSGGGVIGVLAQAGWVGAVVLIGVVLVVVAAVCWVIADPDRPARLALLLMAWRAPGTGAERGRLRRGRSRRGGGSGRSGVAVTVQARNGVEGSGV